MAAYNDTILGPPEIDFSTDSDLSGCLAFTEPGSSLRARSSFSSLICSDGLEQSARLLKCNQSGSFDFVSTLVDRALAQSILDAAVGPGAPMASGVSASELTRVDEEPVLIVSPVVGNYRGCWFYSLNVTTGAVTPTPSRVVEHTPDAILSGICDYHPAATALGIVFGEATFERPQFRLYATGVSP